MKLGVKVNWNQFCFCPGSFMALTALALFPPTGLLEQAVVNMRRLPMKVNAYLMTSSSVPFCGK